MGVTCSNKARVGALGEEGQTEEKEPERGTLLPGSTLRMLLKM
jgi:hypothetical protein